MEKHVSTARPATQSLKHWLESRARRLKLRSLLQRLHWATPAPQPMNQAITKVMQDIAHAENDEQQALCRIIALEEQHREAKQLKKLRHIAPESTPQPEQRSVLELCFIWLLLRPKNRRQKIEN